MDVELAEPELASLDNLIALVGLALASGGGYLVMTEVGSRAGVAGWAMLAAGLLTVFPRIFLGLDLDQERIQVSIMSGQRRFELSEVTGARVVDGWLVIRLGGVAAAGYHAGHFHLRGEGHVQAYASRVRGPFVLVERDGDTPIVVSPARPKRFAQAVRQRSPITAGTGPGA